MQTSLMSGLLRQRGPHTLAARTPAHTPPQPLRAPRRHAAAPHSVASRRGVSPMRRAGIYLCHSDVPDRASNQRPTPPRLAAGRKRLAADETLVDTTWHTHPHALATTSHTHTSTLPHYTATVPKTPPTPCLAGQPAAPQTPWGVDKSMMEIGVCVWG